VTDWHKSRGVQAFCACRLFFAFFGDFVNKYLNIILFIQIFLEKYRILMYPFRGGFLRRFIFL